MVAYVAHVRIHVGDQFHDGFGYGEGIEYRTVAQAFESAAKEAETDAMKRALVKWGNPFGLALYDKAQEMVDNSSGDAIREAMKPKPKPRQAPTDYGMCAEHNMKFFKTPNMTHPGHPIVDSETGERIGFHNMPKTGMSDGLRHVREALDVAVGPDQEARDAMIQSMIGERKQSELTAEELEALADQIKEQPNAEGG